MKKQAITLSLLTLTALPAYAAIDCAVIPTCAELGYNDTVANCRDANNVLKCPFDKTLGKCLGNGAFIGQIAYFAKDPGEGWVLANGAIYHKDKYPELYAKIGTMYGGGGDLFMVPPYAGEGLTYPFLRPAGSTSTTLTKACLPNISGNLGPMDDSLAISTPVATGPFSVTQGYSFDLDSSGSGAYKSGGDGSQLSFNASRVNPVYGSCTHPYPSHYDVAVYIYAGKVGTPATTAKSLSSSCVAGNYYYTDGTCSSSYTSSKTMKGIVRSISSYGQYNSLSYVWGGSGYGNYVSAEVDCRSKASRGHVTDWYDLKTANVPTSSVGNFTALSTTKTYWYYSTSTFKCTSTSPSSCSSQSGVSPNSSYYYYCYAWDYLY